MKRMERSMSRENRTHLERHVDGMNDGHTARNLSPAVQCAM